MSDTRGASVERVERPTYEAFRRAYLAAHKPVVITGAIDDWGASRKWSLPYLASILGDSPVTPIVLANGDFYLSERTGLSVAEMSFSAYLEHIGQAGRAAYYLRHPLDGYVGPLSADYAVPEYCRKRIFMKTNLWVGAPGVATGLHFDLTHNAVAQVMGRRHVVLFAPDQTRYLYPRSVRSLAWHHSQVRVDAPDAERFPEYRNARRVDVDLKAGDLLFIPQGWWHQFTTLDDAIAVNFFWITKRHAPLIGLARLAWTLKGVNT